MKTAIFSSVFLATSALGATAQAASVVKCKSTDASSDLAVAIDLAAPADMANVVLTVNGESTSLAKTVKVLVGQPGTRLAGTTWYQLGLFETVQVDALVTSAANANGVHTDTGSSSVELNGQRIHVACTAE